MIFESIPAGETRQLNGPFYGVRVLTSGSGAVLKVNDLVLPLTALPAWKAQIARVVATGPIYLALADAEDDDVNGAAASPAPPASQADTQTVYTMDAGALAGRNYDFAVPAAARGAAIFLDTSAGSQTGSGQFDCYVKLASTDSFAKLSSSAASFPILAQMQISSLWGVCAQMAPGSILLAGLCWSVPAPMPAAIRYSFASGQASAFLPRLVAQWVFR